MVEKQLMLKWFVNMTALPTTMDLTGRGGEINRYKQPSEAVHETAAFQKLMTVE